MGDLVRRDDRNGLQRADQDLVALLLRGTADLYHYQHRLYRETVEKVVKETQAIEDDVVYDLTVPHARATLEQLGKKSLEITHRAVEAAERRAEEWRKYRR